MEQIEGLVRAIEGRHIGHPHDCAVVEGQHILHLLCAVHAAEGIDARAAVRIAVDLRTVAQGRVGRTHSGKVGQRRVEGMGFIEVGVGSRGVGADQVVVVVRVHLAGHHVLAGILVVAVAHEALLVAVVDDGHAAGKVHEAVRQLVPRQQFGVVRRQRCRS